MDKHALALELYRHNDDIERFSAYLGDYSVNDFEDANEKILALIYQIAGEKIANDYKSEYKLMKFKEKLTDIRTNAAEEVLKLLDEQSEELILIEVAFLFSFFSVLFGHSGKNISVETVENILKYGRYRGLTRKEIVQKLVSGDIQRIFESVSSGLDDNLTLAQLVESVKREMNTTRRYIHNEIDVIVNGIINDTALAFAAKNKLKLMWSSMMDERVCHSCQRDGETWEYDSPDIPSLPAHVRCRCRLIPFDGAIGLDAKIFNITFPEYFNSLDKKEKRKRIGNARYTAYLHGTEKVNKFVEPPLSAFLTAKELQERDSDFVLKS
jgi:SPP1 gp7 family putative phage head morphogenesis protein